MSLLCSGLLTSPFLGTALTQQAGGLESAVKSVTSEGNWVLNIDYCKKHVYPSLGANKEKVKPAIFFREVAYFQMMSSVYIIQASPQLRE